MSITLQKVSAVQDDSGHWYIIPTESLPHFILLLDNPDDETFDETFGQYTTGGDLNCTQLYAEI